MSRKVLRTSLRGAGQGILPLALTTVWLLVASIAPAQGMNLSTVGISAATDWAPFPGTGFSNVTGTASGCGTNVLHSSTPSFNASSGVALLGQRVFSSNAGCRAGHSIGQANGSETAGLRGVAYESRGGRVSVTATWNVRWTYTARASLAGTECSWWGIDVGLYNTSSGTSASSGGYYGSHDPVCIGASSYSDHASGTFRVYVNATLSPGIWYLTSSVYLVTGCFVPNPAAVGATMDLATNGDQAQLVSLVVT